MNKKLTSVVIGVMTIAGLVGPTAFAQSNADLQAQIAALLSQIQTLQGQLGAGSTAPSSYSFSRDLTVGSSGADVKALQQFLNAHGAMVSGSGAGSPGNESTYFGALTKAALAQYQASNNIAPALGYFGPKTRAFLAASAGGTPPVTGGGTGGGVISPASGLAVSMAADNPVAGSIISGAGRMQVLSVNLSAGNNSAVTVNTLKFTKTGVVSDSSISGAYLVQSGKVIAQYTSLGSGVITFSNIGLAIAAGQTAEVTLAVDLSSAASAGNTVGFRINAAADVSATDVANAAITAAGNFPVNGNMMTVSTVTNPSLATLSMTSTTVGGTVFAGTQNVLVSQWTAAAANSAVWLKSLKFRVTGSATKSDIQNVKLYVNGAQVGSTLSSLPASGDAYFDLTANPAKLTTGNSTVQVYADIMGSPSYTFQFQLLNSFDVYAVDSQYNTSLSPTISGSAGTLITINQGQLTVSLSSDSPTGNLAKGQSSVTFAKFKIYAAGEAVKVKWLGFKLAFSADTSLGWDSQIKNVALIDDAGGQVGNTITSMLTAQTCTDSTQTFATGTAGAINCFGSSASPINYIIPANTTRVLSLKGDVQTTANFVSVTASLVGNVVNLQGLTSSQTANSGSVTGSARSLASSALTTAANSAVGTQTFTKNTAAAKIGSYALTASSAEGVTISNLTIQTGEVADVNYQNLIVKVGSTQFGTTYSTLSATTSYTFSGTAFTVPAGQTSIVDVYADVLTNAASRAGAATTLTGCTGNGVSSNSSVSCSSATGQVVNIGGAPTLAIGLDGGSAAAGQLVMGSLFNPLVSFRLTETSNVEDVKITDMVIFQKTAQATTTSFGNLTLYDGSLAVGTAGSGVQSANKVGSSTGLGYNYVFHFATPVIVTKSSSKTLVLKGDVSSYASGGATDVSTSTFSIATSTEYATTSTLVTALGASSNTAATNVLSAPNGNTQTVLRSVLTVTAASAASPRPGKSTVDDVGTITFTASSAGSISLNQVVLTYSGSMPSSTGGATSFNSLAANLKLYDPSTGAQVAGSSATTVATTSATFVYTIGTTNTGYILSAGASKTFTVRADSLTDATAGSTGISQTFGLTLASSTAVSYVDAIDGTGTTVNLPATAVPMVIVNVSYPSGT